MNNNMRTIRTACGLTIQDLVAETGISRVTLSRYERGEKDLHFARADTLIRIADALGITDIRLFFIRLPEGSSPAEFFWPS